MNSRHEPKRRVQQNLVADSRNVSAVPVLTTDQDNSTPTPENTTTVRFPSYDPEKPNPEVRIGSIHSNNHSDKENHSENSNNDIVTGKEGKKCPISFLVVRKLGASLNVLVQQDV